MAKITPLFDNLVLVPDANNISDGGILLPETARDNPQTGVVVAIGEGKHENGVFIPSPDLIGKKVIFRTSIYDSLEVMYGSSKALVIKLYDVIAVVEG